MGEPEAKMRGEPHTLTPLELHQKAWEQLLEPRRSFFFDEPQPVSALKAATNSAADAWMPTHPAHLLAPSRARPLGGSAAPPQPPAAPPGGGSEPHPHRAEPRPGRCAGRRLPLAARGRPLPLRWSPPEPDVPPPGARSPRGEAPRGRPEAIWGARGGTGARHPARSGRGSFGAGGSAAARFPPAARFPAPSSTPVADLVVTG